MLTDDPKLACSCLCEYVSNIYTARCKWALNNFESWRPRVSVQEFFPNDVLSSDDPKLLCSCIPSGNEEGEWTAVSGDGGAETDFRSAIRAPTSTVR